MNTNFKKRFWISVAVIGGSLIFGFFGVIYLSGNLHANAAAIVSDRATVQAQNTALARFADLERDEPVAATYEAAYDRLVPDQFQLINFQDVLDASSKAFQVTATYSFQGALPSIDPNTVGMAPITLNISGTLPNVIAFLRALESKSQGYIVKIDSYSLTQDGAGNVQFTGFGSLFFQSS